MGPSHGTPGGTACKVLDLLGRWSGSGCALGVGMVGRSGKLVGALVGVLAAGCGEASEDPSELPVARNQQYGGPGPYATPDWGCRSCGFTNSPQLGDEILTKFAVGQVTDPQLHTITAIEDPTGKRYDVQLVEGRFEALLPSGQVAYGMQTLGWSLILEWDGVERELEIAHYEEHPDWVDGLPVPTYSLLHDHPPGGGDAVDIPLCPGFSGDETFVTAYAGAVFDQSNLTVTHEPDLATFGCAGHIVAKLRMMGYTPDDPYGSDLPQQQAAVKMLSADYCGTGHSFTAIGTPLAWTDALGNFGPWSSQAEWVSGGVYDPDATDMEARWDQDGAICLDTPRLADLGDIKNECNGNLPPRCEGDAHENADFGAHLSSFNPPAP